MTLRRLIFLVLLPAATLGCAQPHRIPSAGRDPTLRGALDATRCERLESLPRPDQDTPSASSAVVVRATAALDAAGRVRTSIVAARRVALARWAERTHAGDAVRCVDRHLIALRALSCMLEGREGALRRALASGDSERIRHEAVLLWITANRAQTVGFEARSCLGDEPPPPPVHRLLARVAVTDELRVTAREEAAEPGDLPTAREARRATEDRADFSARGGRSAGHGRPRRR